MIYQETYQAGGNPSKMNISSVIYTRDLCRSTPPDSLRQVMVFRLTVTLFMKSATQ